MRSCLRLEFSGPSKSIKNRGCLWVGMCTTITLRPGASQAASGGFLMVNVSDFELILGSQRYLSESFMTPFGSKRPFLAVDIIRIIDKHLTFLEQEKIRVYFEEKCPPAKDFSAEEEEHMRVVRILEDQKILLQEFVDNLNEDKIDLEQRLALSVELGIDLVKNNAVLIENYDFLADIPKSFVELTSEILLKGLLLTTDIRSWLSIARNWRMATTDWPYFLDQMEMLIQNIEEYTEQFNIFTRRLENE